MYSAAKGVFDILPFDPDPTSVWRSSHLWQFLESHIRKLTHVYGYREIRTPLFETTDLFTRSIGGETDIVSKEMYTFLDKADRSLTLRPEGTASVMRAFIEKHLSEHALIHKFFYIGPMFRYERQQAGRYRQHHQFGVEAIGSHSPCQDAECIDLLFSFLRSLGLKGLVLNLNSIGRLEARQNYIRAFKDFLAPKLTLLSEESRRRYETNPLRILDSKDPADQHELTHAPSILDFLSVESKLHFDTVLELVTARGIPYTLNPRLVRGLDYYNDTVFEVVSQDLGAQNSLGGGGRYDGLLKQLGGPDLPSCGFGSGLERVLQTLIKQQVSLPQPPVVQLLLVPMGERATRACFDMVGQLRDAHVACELELSQRRLKTILSQASELKIPYVAVVGDRELEGHPLELKHMGTGQVEHVTLSDLPNKLCSSQK